MSVKDPFFQCDKREDIITNISAMPDEDKDRYGFIWKAELTNGSEIVQFDARGKENNYAQVREKLDENKVDGLYFVPVKAGMDSYGVNLSDIDGGTGLMRRGFIRHSQTGGVEEQAYVARIQAGDKYLYIDSNGDTVTSHNENLNVYDKLVDR
jgi:hypothetical protein